MATQTPSAEYARALAENERYAAQFDRSSLPLPPGRRLAVIACMDARLTVEDVLALRSGDAHVIRNAGGLATDDAIRSLVISQHLLGTTEVIVIEHTGCGMLTFRDDDVQRDLAAKTGKDVDLPLGAFRGSRDEPAARRSIGSVPIPGSRTSPFTASSTKSRRDASGRSSDGKELEKRWATAALSAYGMRTSIESNATWSGPLVTVTSA